MQSYTFPSILKTYYVVDTLVSTIDWRCFAYFDKEKYILEAKVTVN